MSFLESALSLAEKGFYVFPLQPNGKLPLKDFNFNALATKDPVQIKKWWVDPVMGFEQPYNVGIATTKFNGSQALVVVDVDNKGKKKGSDQLLKLELEGFDFVETATQVTPTGGLHLVYRSPEPVKQGVSVLGEGLDIRSKGGYIVASGSIIDGKPYVWEKPDLDIKPCPPWIIERCGKFKEPTNKAGVEDTSVDSEGNILRAKAWVDNDAEPSIEGEGGDERAFKVAAKLKDFGISRETALELMLGHWNQKCQPPWSDTELRRKIDNAYNYGQENIGSKSPEAEFQPVKKLDDKNYLQEMNENYAVVFSEGEASILFETVDEKGRPKREFMKESAFKRKFSPYFVGEGKKITKTYADIWLDWEGRREYNGLCFKPELEAENGYYNLWRGFPVKQTEYGKAGKSAQMGFDMFIDHAKNNVCKGDEKLFNWLMGYFSHMIQKPFERPHTTLVFRGRKGVGKNVVVDRVGKLLGSGHFLTAHNSRYLTSNFNGHLDSCLMLVLDEAFWSGDKASEGVLKGLTTAEEIMIERKGREPYMVDNLARLCIIGNEDWLVPASADERRYAVFDVGDARKQDIPYFRQLCNLIDKKGGAEILMHYFKNFDLRNFEPNTAPSTEGLNDQKLDSMGPLENFWFESLKEGRLVYADFQKEWQERVPKKVVRDAFTAFCKDRNVKTKTPTEFQFSRLLRELTPSLITDLKDLADDGSRPRIFQFKNLETCRREWDRRMGFNTIWE